MNKARSPRADENSVHFIPQGEKHGLKNSLILGVLLVGLWGVVTGCGPSPDPVPEGSLVIELVAVVDVDEGAISNPKVVVIDGQRIWRIAEPGNLNLRPAATIVDGRDQYLIPGLWDMHVHAMYRGFAAQYMELMATHGITGFREMWGDLGLAARVRKEQAEGQRVAPRFVLAGNLIDGDPPTHNGSHVATTPEEGRQLVRQLKAAGAEFIKPYDGLSKETYIAIAEEAKTVGLPLWGHVPQSVSTEEAMLAGQTSMEHLRGFRCSAYEEELGKVLEQEEFREDPWNPKWDEHFARYDSEWDAQLCHGKFDRLAEAGVRQVPTLVTTRGRTKRAFEVDRYEDPRLRWLLSSTVLGFEEHDRFGGRTVDATLIAEMDREWTKKSDLVKHLHARGTEILAGSDLGNPWVIPGAGLHDELTLFVEAGMTPQEALASATTAPARFLGLDADLGTVREGALADLVMIRSNPLEDIEAVREIEAVVLDGDFLDRDALDRRLARLEERSDWRETKKLVDTMDSSGVEAVIKTIDHHEALVVDTVLTLGRHLRGAKDYEGALRLIEWAEDRFPDDWQIAELKGGVFAARGGEGDRERAIEIFRKSIDLEPPDSALEQRILYLKRKIKDSAGN